MVHLVESNLKKAAFLREAARLTGAPAKVHAVRIEDFVDGFAEPVEIVTAGRSRHSIICSKAPIPC